MIHTLLIISIVLAALIAVCLTLALVCYILELVSKYNVKLCDEAQKRFQAGASIEEILQMRLPKKLRKRLVALKKQFDWEDAHNPFPEYDLTH